LTGRNSTADAGFSLAVRARTCLVGLSLRCASSCAVLAAA